MTENKLCLKLLLMNFFFFQLEILNQKPYFKAAKLATSTIQY